MRPPGTNLRDRTIDRRAVHHQDDGAGRLPAGDPVRVVSLNAWGGARWDHLAEWLPVCGADIVCVQEVTRTPGVVGRARFADGERDLPQRADLFADMAALLPRHQRIFVACDAGPVHDDDGHVHRQQFGIATFVDDRLPVVAVTAAHVHGTFADHERWPTTGRPRAALAVRVHDPDTGRAATVAHLHGLRDEEGKHDTPARRAQAGRTAALVERTRQRGDLTVVCGDLNVLPGSETLAVLSEELALVDLVGTADTRTSQYAKAIRHASYMLVSDPRSVVDFEIVVAPEVSDHRPLVLDCRP